MGRPRGFVEIQRVTAGKLPVTERLRDAREFELPMADAPLREQAARCMDCGIPFCHQGCPLGNLIPEWNDLVLAGRWDDAAASLHATNNFPEITGRVCPAPCEGSCVLDLAVVPGDEGARTSPGAVTIKQIERQIADRALDTGHVVPRRAPVRSGRRAAVVGSGPAGLAAAQELARAGHDVTVFERDDRIGGLLRYGIPDFKLEKAIVDRRVAQLRDEGVQFRTGVEVGRDVSVESLRSAYGAVVLAGGAGVARDLVVEGRDLAGVHLAMALLAQHNRRVAGDVIAAEEEITAAGKHVVVLGGGDTGSDCVGTALRLGAASVTSLELLPRPPDARASTNPWPAWPVVFRTSSSHEEGGTREFGVMTRSVVGEGGRVRGLEVVRCDLRDGVFHPVLGSERELPCDLLLLAMGFTGPRRTGLLDALGVALDARGNVAVDRDGATSVPGVFAAGDMARGASLVVWAIAEGRRAARAAAAWLERPER